MHILREGASECALCIATFKANTGSLGVLISGHILNIVSGYYFLKVHMYVSPGKTVCKNQALRLPRVL